MKTKHKYKEKELAFKLIYILIVIISAVLCIGKLVSLDGMKIEYDKERYETFNDTHVKIDITGKDKLEQMCVNLSYGGKVDYIIINSDDYTNFDKSQYGFNGSNGDTIYITVNNEIPVNLFTNGRFTEKDENYLRSLVSIQGKDLYTNLVEVLSAVNIGVHNLDKHYYLDVKKISLAVSTLVVISTILCIIDIIKEVGVNEYKRGKKD